MGKGTLKVLVKQATNLKDSQWIGKQDPFAIVWAGPYSSRTKVHFGTRSRPVAPRRPGGRGPAGLA